MKRKSFLTYSLAAVMLWFSGCELAETNIDPVLPTDVSIEVVMPSMLTQAAFNQSANPARVIGIVMQYYEGIDAQQLAYTFYQLPQNTFNNYWRTGLYAGVQKDCEVIIEKALDEDNPRPHYEGIAKIIQAHELAMATSYFGDIPYTEAQQGLDNLTPGYDLQEDVFNAVQALLDEGIALLSGPSSAVPPGGDDLVFGGNASAWIATAWAFKARYHMMVSKRDGEAATKVLADLGNAFTSLEGQPNFAWGSAQTENNPLSKFGIERSNTLGVAPSFANTLVDNGDPRASSYTAFQTDGETGDTVGYAFWAGSVSNLTWTQNASVIPMISYSEVKFLEAEALLRTGVSDAAVQAAMEEGILASMALNGIDSATAAPYLAGVPDLASLAGFEEKLDAMMTEAYYSYFGFAMQQAWANFRRTGYPSLTANPDGAGGLNPTGVIPRRFLYPDSETQFNEEKLNEATTRQDPNGDGFLLDDDIWAFRD
jgi:hypothetical protein